MKVELKYLAGYLSYGLKCVDIDDNTINVITGLKIRRNELWYYYDTGFKDRGRSKPILRPLSDLTIEIEHNGEKFVPYIKLAKKYSDFSGYNEDIKIYRNKCFLYSKSSEIEFRFNGSDFVLNGNIVNSQYDLFQRLYEWYFDIHGLIEAGLAIDINTLNKEQIYDKRTNS